MKQKFISVLAGLALSVTAVTAGAETVLRVGSVAPTKSPWGAWITKVAAHLDTISKGELKLNLLLDGQVGDELTMVRQAQKGRLDMVFVSNDPIAVLVPEMDLTSAPFLFDTIEQGTCVQHEHLAGLYGPLLEEKGLLPVTWMEVGNSIIFSRKPLRTPDDMKALRIRVAQGEVKNAYFRKLGTTPSPLGVADVVPALQTGTIDAVTYPVVYGIAVGIPGMAPNLLKTNHYRLIGSLAISQKSWNRLSKQEREWLMTVAPMGLDLTAAILGAETALLAKVAAAGVNVHEFTAKEEAAWRATGGKTFAQEQAEKMGPRAIELMAKLNEALTACSK